MDRLPPEHNESHCRVRLPESLQHDGGEADTWPGRYASGCADSSLASFWCFVPFLYKICVYIYI